uniref:TYRO protein tyrosine kinase-binding protein n=1 Tax=Chrysemys picta bellii TaxID=8478 RepID=A0A8C3F8A7_CHRPI
HLYSPPCSPLLLLPHPAPHPIPSLLPSSLSGGLIAGLVVGDLLLTLLIAVAVYCLAGKIHLSRGSAQGTAPGSTLGPGGELQGQRMDIYSDLKKSGANY